MEDDSRSTASGGSTQSSSNSKIECPVCNKEMTLKYIFNHIRTKHVSFFHQMTTREWLEEASTGKPLKVMWEVKDDFDDMNIITVFGCLSTNKTFKSEYQAATHFKKDPKALKDHNKQIKDLIKTRKRVLEDKQKKVDTLPPKTKRFLEAAEIDCPTVKAELRKSMDKTMTACERLCEDVAGIPDCTTESVDHPAMHTQTVRETIELFRKLQREYSNPEQTIKFLRRMNHLLWRVLKLRDAVLSYTNKDAPHYAYYKSENNPSGLLDRGDSEYSDFF